MFRVDEFGFYIYWKSEGREGDVLDLSQVGQAPYYYDVNVFVCFYLGQ